MAAKRFKENIYQGYPDIHMNTAKGNTLSSPDVRMATAKGTVADVRMRTARADTTKSNDNISPRHRKLLASPEVQRKATVAQLYFLDYYFQHLGYISARKERRTKFDEDTEVRGLTHSEHQKEWKSYCGRERVVLRRRRAKLRVEQFHIITQVGQGGYGEVYLARKQETGEVCALKRMKKKTLQKMDEIRHVLVERDILTATRTPWLVRLLYAFQDNLYVYLAMEYVPGGDFRTFLNNTGIMHEKYSLFYATEMFVAVNELHKLGYIHRDLKPENFLLDGIGHVKLTDFGLATGALNPQRIESLRIKLDKAKDNKIVQRSTMERRSLFKTMQRQNPQWADSIVGSPDYMAPEVLRGKPYTYAVDYWSLGCILFELLAGFPPFTGQSPEETWTNLQKWPEVLNRPVYDGDDAEYNMSDEAWGLITKLITHAEVRYKSLEDLKTHSWVEGVHWEELREYEAPYVPELYADTDTRYFDDFSSEDDMAKYQEVRDKQKNVEEVEEVDKPTGRGVWVGFTFGKSGPNAKALGAMGAPDENGAMATIF